MSTDNEPADIEPVDQEVMHRAAEMGPPCSNMRNAYSVTRHIDDLRDELLDNPWLGRLHLDALFSGVLMEKAPGHATPEDGDSWGTTIEPECDREDDLVSVASKTVDLINETCPELTAKNASNIHIPEVLQRGSGCPPDSPNAGHECFRGPLGISFDAHGDFMETDLAHVLGVVTSSGEQSLPISQETASQLHERARVNLSSESFSLIDMENALPNAEFTFRADFDFNTPVRRQITTYDLSSSKAKHSGETLRSMVPNSRDVSKSEKSHMTGKSVASGKECGLFKHSKWIANLDNALDLDKFVSDQMPPPILWENVNPTPNDTKSSDSPANFNHSQGAHPNFVLLSRNVNPDCKSFLFQPISHPTEAKSIFTGIERPSLTKPTGEPGAEREPNLLGPDLTSVRSFRRLSGSKLPARVVQYGISASIEKDHRTATVKKVVYGKKVIRIKMPPGE